MKTCIHIDGDGRKQRQRIQDQDLKNFFSCSYLFHFQSKSQVGGRAGEAEAGPPPVAAEGLGCTAKEALPQLLRRGQGQTVHTEVVLPRHIPHPVTLGQAVKSRRWTVPLLQSSVCVTLFHYFNCKVLCKRFTSGSVRTFYPKGSVCQPYTLLTLSDFCALCPSCCQPSLLYPLQFTTGCSSVLVPLSLHDLLQKIGIDRTVFLA